MINPSFFRQEKIDGIIIMRLGSQSLGPLIQNLEPFRNVETIQLQNNLITEISRDSFRQNMKIQFIALQKNKITQV